MSRTKIEWRSSSRENYNDFKVKHPSIKISFQNWKNVVYEFNEAFRDHILETGEKIKMPFGFGDFSINKRKREKIKTVDGKEFVNLPIDWQKTKQKGKTIYNMNYHTDGYSFRWLWFKKSSRIKNPDLWYFRACRDTSKMLAHYLFVDPKYQQLYSTWEV